MFRSKLIPNKLDFQVVYQVLCFHQFWWKI